MPHTKDWSIFPNPAADVAVLDFKDLPNEPLTIQLVDLNGSIALEVKGIASAQVQLALTSVKSGLYLVKLTQGSNKVGTKKLVIIK